MFNCIGNTCIASYITSKILNQSFINPFCWSILDFNSAYDLVKSFRTLNWYKFNLECDSDLSNFRIIVDNCIIIRYLHYLFSSNAASIIKKEPDIIYCRIWEYIVSKYIERVKRMLHTNIKPRFIFTTPTSMPYSTACFSIDEQYKLASVDTDYPIVMSFPETIKHKNVITIAQTKTYSGNNLQMATDIYKSIPTVYWT